MKSGFSLVKSFTPTWNGNDKSASPLTVTLKMPTVEDLFDILDKLNTNGVNGEVDPTKLGIKRNTQIAKEAGSLLPTYVVLDNAEDFTIEDAVKYPPYFPLVVELLFALIQFAQPSEADENSQ